MHFDQEGMIGYFFSNSLILVDAKQFRGMIRSLLYLTFSSTDIQFCVCLCVRFQASPRESHLTVVKKIYRYLAGTQDIGLWYPTNYSLELITYTDADYAGSRLDRKSTSGYCQFLGGCLVSWASKKQHSVALSTVEVEYVAAGSYTAQVLWINHQLQDYHINLGCVPIMCDNTSAISLTKNLIQNSKTKRIEIRHHFLRDEVGKNKIILTIIDTEKKILMRLPSLLIMIDFFLKKRT